MQEASGHIRSDRQVTLTLLVAGGLFLSTPWVLLNPRPDGVWRVTRPDGGWPKGPPPLLIFKSKSRRVKIQTALERSRRTLQDKIMLTLFFLPVTSQEGQRRSKKVKMY